MNGMTAAALCATGDWLPCPPYAEAGEWARFAAHIAVIPGGCHLWLGGQGDGYGEWLAPPPAHSTPILLPPEPERAGAHRWSWTAHHGPVPAGLLVLHDCDERICVRPECLIVGTAGDNARARQARGRAASRRHGLRRYGADTRGPHGRSQALRDAVRNYLAAGWPPAGLPALVAQVDAAPRPHAGQLTLDGLTA